MNNLNNNTTYGKIFFLALSLTLFVGFYFNEDLSGGGTSTDFKNTWLYVLFLKESFFGYEDIPKMLPLHYFILAKLNVIIPNKDFVRLFFILLSLLVPILFYLNLKLKFPQINKNLLLFFTSTILLFPTFRSSAIWANGHITAFIFFLAAIFFYLRWKRSKKFNINLDLILQIFFLSLSVYTRQYYAIFFIYYLIIYFQKLALLDFFKICAYIFFLTLPGFWLIYTFPHYLIGSSFTHKFYNTILINSSMMSFYLIPLFFPLLLEPKNFFISNIKFFIVVIAVAFSMVLILSNQFDYNPSIGGGFFLKLSNLIFGNNILFYFTSLIGLVLLSFLCKESKNNLILIFLIFLAFNVTTIFQKYHEPMLLFIYFLIFNSKLSLQFFKDYKPLVFLYLYTVLYFAMALINSVAQITRNYNF